ncbi:hypothetical protein HDU98_000993 [Podochytrium sp. JEL0797]|nr:hypothetical protein HDU98_000993 [Podochytrium sp. JEL0797]
MSSIVDDSSAKEALDTTAEGGKLHRTLESRHLEMIAIGGTIGTGLLLKSGNAIATAGPVGALLCFALVGLQIYGTAAAIGEMTTYLPVEGAFSALPLRFVNPAFGFASGWNYGLNWCLIFPAQLAGIANLMLFWISSATCPSWVWSLVYLVPIIGLNCFPVSNFAEVEFYLSYIKVIAIVVFLMVSFCVWFGAGTGTGALWFTNWSPAIQGVGSIDQFVNIAGGFTTAILSFGGTELVGLAAGEAENPRKNVPKAINGTFFKIFAFYILCIFFVGVLLDPNDPILQAVTVNTSPFVYVYKSIGIGFAGDMMNAVIVIAVATGANSAVYACARTLTGLSAEGSAPKIIGRVDKRGVPVVSVAVIALFGIAAVVAAYTAGPDGAGYVFDWLASVISFNMLTAWVFMLVCHLRFRAGYLAQGRKLEDLPYIAPFYPYMDYLCLTLAAFSAFCMFLSAFYGVDEYNVKWFTSNAWVYAGFPFSVTCYFSHAAFKSGFGLVKYEDMDFESGKYIETAADREANEQEEERPKGFKAFLDKLRNSKILNLK